MTADYKRNGFARIAATLRRGASLFRPTLWQCWAIVLYTCIGGSLLLLVFLTIRSILSGETKMNMLLMYLLQFVPALCYLLYKWWRCGKKVAAGVADISAASGLPHSDRAGEASGGLEIFLLFFFAAAGTLLLGVAITPLGDIIQMPESIAIALYKPILENPLLAFVTTAVAAAVVEEFFLRGMILKGLLHYVKPLYAILWSAFFFALIHLNLYQASAAFIMGLFFGWVYYISGSLKLTMFMHFVNNGSAVVLVLLFPDMPFDASILDIFIPGCGAGIYFAVIFAAAVAFAAILYLMNKKFRRTIVW